MKRILIANRGEIAARVMRTAHALGYETVAVYSEPDADAPHVRLATFAYALGGESSAESYLDMDKILRACEVTGADAVHPGYGFLSERASFARALHERGITFIGPPVAAIEAMGSKAESKRLMEAAEVPCVPGYHGESQEESLLISEAERIGYPVMVKASAGGGGKGMRLVREPAALSDALRGARSEALASFGDDKLLLERAILEPRHVEIQVFADAHGNVVHLGERDCSVQRRHQKVIEEAPGVGVSAALREAMGSAAVAAARAIGYVGAGTVEFLLLPDGETFYFLEMNTRLQVEHPVTEAITGFDLVAWQLAVASGEPLPVTQEEVRFRGHAIEVRVYAEDPYHDFLPQAGRLARWEIGGEVRVDAGVRSGQEISPFYDPMLAKVIAWGEDREAARRKLTRALRQSAVLGTRTNLSFLLACLEHPSFVAGGVSTRFIEEAFGGKVEAAPLDDARVALGAVLRGEWRSMARGYEAPFKGWSSTGYRSQIERLEIDGREEPVTIEVLWHGGERREVRLMGREQVHHIEVVWADLEQGRARVRWRDRVEEARAAFDEQGRFWVSVAGEAWCMEDVLRRPASGDAASQGRIVAPMAGKLLQVRVAAGEEVEQGDVVMILEAMKMEHELRAPRAGKVSAVYGEGGEQVSARQVLLELE